MTGLCRRRVGDEDLQRFGGKVGRFPMSDAGGWGGFPARGKREAGFLAPKGCCRRDDGICSILGAMWEGFSARGEVSRVRGCCRQDDAPGNSGGTVASRTTLQATMEILAAWGKEKENELLGPVRTNRFVRFVGETIDSSNPILGRSLSDPIGQTEPEP